jgi:predicted kinase
MDAIILIGIQASGKSTFYKEKFFNNHIRISNDLLKTKNREKLLIKYCFETQISLVIDNTNATKLVRAKYINILKQMNYQIKGYYFKTALARALERNENRIDKEYVPKLGILATHKMLEIPSMQEGFDELYYVENTGNKFIIKEWKNEI